MRWLLTDFLRPCSQCIRNLGKELFDSWAYYSLGPCRPTFATNLSALARCDLSRSVTSRSSVSCSEFRENAGRKSWECFEQLFCTKGRLVRLAVGCPLNPKPSTLKAGSCLSSNGCLCCAVVRLVQNGQLMCPCLICHVEA